MYGFEAISHHNGWVAAATGACIVFAGLAMLAFLISQLHKLLNLLDRPPKVTVTVAPPEPPAAARPEDPLDLERTVERYLPLIEELDAEFVLADLYVLARKYHLPMSTCPFAPWWRPAGWSRWVRVCSALRPKPARPG